MTVDGLYAPRPMRAEDPLGGALARLEVPDCGCRPPKKVCGHGGPCDCDCEADGLEALIQQFAPPCRHVLAADHGLTPERWLDLLRCFDRVGHDDPPPPAAPALALTRGRRLAVYEERAVAAVLLHFPKPPGSERRTGDLMLEEDRERFEIAIGVQGKRPADLAGGDLVAAWEEEEDAVAAGLEGDDALSRCAVAALKRQPPPPHPRNPLRRGEETPATLPFAPAPQRRAA